MEWTSIAVAVLAFLGTLGGSILTQRKSTALIAYRLEELEAKVDRHNKVIDRTYHLEQDEAVIAEQIKVINHRIEDLEKLHKSK